MAFVDKLLVKGDRVIMNMDAEARGHVGDKYPPNGTLGTFMGRHRIQIYRGRVGTDRYRVSISGNSEFFRIRFEELGLAFHHLWTFVLYEN